MATRSHPLPRLSLYLSVIIELLWPSSDCANPAPYCSRYNRSDTDAEKLILFEIINGRYEARRPTIIISNLAIGELERYLGARAVDRLREGGGKVVVFDWESYRGRREGVAA